MDCPPVFDPEMAEFQTSDFDIDIYDVSATVSLGAQERSIISIKMDMEEESDTGCKQCVYLSVPENTSPLGLILRKTPSFLDLVETKLSHSNSCSMPRKRKSADADAQQINGKAKASNFSALLLQIGSWEQVSRFDGQLVAKCYFAKRKLVWELLDGGLKNKIEVPWSDIASMKATYNDNAPHTLEIELLKRPRFFRETNPQPRKHTQWKATDDFTGGEASIFRRHILKFPQGTLQRHYEKLLQMDYGLSLLNKKPYPSFHSPFFDADSMESPNANDCKLFELTGQSSDLLKRLIESRTSDFSEQIHCLNLSRPMLPQQYTNLDNAIDASVESSLCSGLNGRYVARGTSILTKDVLPSLIVSLPTSAPDVGTHDIGESYCHVEKRTQDVLANLLLGNNLGVTDLHHGKLKSKVNIDSIFESKSNCWITEIQDDQNPVSSSANIVHSSQIDMFFNGLSSSGKVCGNLLGEVSGDSAEHTADISGTATFPLFLLDDEAAPNEVREVLECVPWTN